MGTTFSDRNEGENAMKRLPSYEQACADLIADSKSYPPVRGVTQDKREMLRRGLDYGGDGLDSIAIHVDGLGVDRVSSLHARRPFSDDVRPGHE